MSTYGLADPDQLSILAKAISDHCSKFEIVDEEERERIALRVFILFGCGMTDPVQLSTELERGCSDNLSAEALPRVNVAPEFEEATRTDSRGA